MTPTILSDERERILEFTRRLPSMSHWMFLLAPKPETGHMQTLLLKHWWPTHEVKTSPLSNLLLVQQGWVEMILRKIQCPCYLPWRLPGCQAHSVPDICAVNHPLTFLSWRDDNNSGRDDMLHSLPEAPVLPPLFSVSSVCVCPCVPVSVCLLSTLTLWEL